MWLAWLLATCGFGILLGGVTSMQQVRRQAGCLGAQGAAAATMNERQQPGGSCCSFPGPGGSRILHSLERELPGFEAGRGFSACAQRPPLALVSSHPFPPHPSPCARPAMAP